MSDEEGSLSTGQRIQNAKTRYDLEIDDHAQSECELCEKLKDDVRTMDVQNESNGVKKTVALCPNCRDITKRYNRGKNVEWPEVVSN